MGRSLAKDFQGLGQNFTALGHLPLRTGHEIYYSFSMSAYPHADLLSSIMEYGFE